MPKIKFKKPVFIFHNKKINLLIPKIFQKQNNSISIKNSQTLQSARTNTRNGWLLSPPVSPAPTSRICATRRRSWHRGRTRSSSNKSTSRWPARKSSQDSRRRPDSRRRRGGQSRYMSQVEIRNIGEIEDLGSILGII